MATTLEGFFLEDDDCLMAKIREAIGRGRLNKPWKATVSWQDLGSQTYPKIGELVGEPLQEGGLLGVVEALKQIVIDRRGADAIGTLKVRLYEAGRANDMAVDFTRKIGVDAVATSADKLLLDRLLARIAALENQNTGLVGQVVAQSQVVAQVSVEQNKGIAALSTQRAVTTGAADAQGLGSLVTLGILVFGWPLFKKALDLPEDASPAQLVRMVTGATMKSWERLQDPAKDPKPRVNHLPQVAELASSAAPDSALPDPALPDPEVLLERLMAAPPEYQDRMKKVFKGRMSSLLELMA